MLLIGFSMRLTDKRVDRMIRKNGYHANKVFHSPIQTWFVFWFLMICMALPISFSLGGLIAEWVNVYMLTLFVIGYFVMGYFVSSYFNTSIALNSRHLLAVNPNFPFRRIRKFNLSEIKSIRLGASPYLIPAIVFGVVERNFVQVTTREGSFIFYCAGLGEDSFDENWTEETFDGLYHELQRSNVPVTWELE